MKIAVTSQNFRTITGHAGKTRRFLMFCGDSASDLAECERLDLPRDMSMHAFQGDVHPVDSADVLITAGCGDGFKRRMAARGIRVVTTSETDPLKAAQAVLAGTPLPPPVPHDHG